MEAAKAHGHAHGEKRKADAPGGLTAPEVLSIGSNASVLNATNAGALAAVLAYPQPAEVAVPLKSDSDEQLLVSLELPSTHKLHAIKLAGPADGTAPSTVKLFINRAAMDFSDCEDLCPTQTVTLNGASATIPLQLTKFQQVNSLHVFIESNQGDEESTCLSRIELVGVPVPTTNMKDLKKGG